jgi:cytochrome c oxidase cbb3-type subunit III
MSYDMKRRALIALLCALAVAGCVRKQDGMAAKPAAGDTTQVADSSAPTLPAEPVKVLTYEEMQGAVLFRKYCAVCHGEEGKGDGFNAFNLDPRPRDLSDSTYMKALSDDQIVQTISGGGKSVNKSPLMPAYGWTLGKPQIRYVASYVRSFIQPEKGGREP